MANDIIIKFRVQKDGTLKAVQKEAEAASKSTKKLGKSTDDLTNSRNRYNKAEKGAAGLGANATKNFSKMNQTMGGSSGLVAAYATLAANAFALTAALNALSRAAAFEQLANGLKLVGSQAGQNLPYVADQLKDITNGALSAEQALRATAVATTSGFSTDQLRSLTKVAKGASVALGRDLGDALDRLVRGTAKLEPEILDELGIIVRLDDATEKYAASVGKVAGDLTTFERQQAFLNATIEQGEKKYGALANRLDTNPYEKLAAAFNDLAKSILTGVNTFLGPFAEFLSQNTFALFGALTAFTASITRALFPALTGMAEKAAAIHISAAAAAKRSGKVISAAYVKQQAEVVRLAGVAGKALPASFSAGLPKLEAGKMSVRELTKLLNNLKKSEALRAAALKNQGAQASAAKQKELADIRALRLETEKLIAAESTRATVNMGGAVSRARSQTGRRTANAIGVIENQGAFGGLKVALKNAGNEFKAFQKTAEKNNTTLSAGAARIATFRAGLTGAAGAARVFGAALLNAIPVLGQLLFVISIIGPYLADILGFGKTDPVDEATKGFKSFSEISLELSRNLALARTEGEKNFLTMKAGAGIIDQTIAAFRALSDAQLAEAQEDFDSSIKARLKFRRLQKQYSDEAAEAQKKLNDMEARYKGNPQALKASGTYRRLSRELEHYTEKAEQFGKRAETFGLRVSEGIAGAAEVSAAKGIRTLETAINRLETAPDGAENFAGELSLLKDALKEMEKPGANVNKILKDLGTARNQRLAITKAVDNATDILSQFNAEVARLGRQAPTKFQTATDFVKSMAKEVNRLKDDQEQLNDFLKDNEAGKSIVKLIERAGVDNLNEVAQLLDQNNTIIANTALNAKEYEQISKRISQASAANVELTRQQIEFEQRVVKAKIAGLKAEISNTNILEGGADAQEKIARLKREITQLNDKLVDTAEENFRIENASIKAAQRQLDFAKRRAAIVERQFQIEQRLLKLQIDIDRARAGQTSNPIDEYRLAKNAAKEQKDIEDAKFKLSTQRLTLEFRLLDNQLLLEQKRMERVAAEMRAEAQKLPPGLPNAVSLQNDASALEASAGGITGVRAEAGGVTAAEIIAEYEALGQRKIEIDNNVTLLGIKADRYRFEQRRALIQAEAEYYKLLGAAELGITTELQVAREDLKRLEEERAKLIKAGLDTSEKDVEIQKAKTRELQKQLDLIDAQTQKLQDGFSFNSTLSSQAGLQGAIATSSAKVGSAYSDYEKALKARESFDFSGFAENFGEEAAFEKLNELGTAAEDAGRRTGEALRTGFITAGAAMKEFINSAAADMASLGPEGAIFSPVLESLASLSQALFNLAGVFSEALGPDKLQAISEGGLSISEAFNQMKPEEKAAAMGAAFATAAQGIAAVSSLLTAQTNQRVSAIDKEIEAEKKRDGKSQQSLAKIAQLEKKKEAMKKKDFEITKKLKMAEIVMNTAAGIAMAAASVPTPFLPPFIAMISALGAAQLAIVSGMSYQGGGSSIGNGAATSVSVGERKSSVDMAKSQGGAGEIAYMRGERGTGGPENFTPTPAFTGAKYRANGGNTAFMVGEQGPELFVPEKPGRIIPNDEVQQGTPINATINISAVDAAGVEDVLMNQRGNIISMIRDAANAQGNTFLEEINVAEL